MWMRLLAGALESVPTAGRMAAVPQLVCEPLGFLAAWYGIADFRTRTIRVEQAAGLLDGTQGRRWAEASFARTPEGNAAMSGRTQTTTIEPSDPLLSTIDIPREISEPRLRFTVPVQSDGSVVGTLSAYSASEPSPSTLALLHELAEDLLDDDPERRTPPGYLAHVAEGQLAPIVILRCAEGAEVEIAAVNGIAAALLGRDRDACIGLRDVCLPSRYEATAILRELKRLCHEGGTQAWTDEPVQDHRSDREEWLDITAVAVADMLIVTWRTVTDRYLAMRRAQDAARRDHLTNLGSRAVLVEQLHDVLGAPRRSGNGVAVCVIGIDGLSRINEALSLAAGDEVLRLLAGRLVAEVGDARLVARLSGDEFAVILSDVRGPDGAMHAAEMMRDHMMAPMRVLEQEMTPSVSLGIAYATSATDPEALLHDAGLAVRRAKERGRGRIESADPQLAIDALERHRLEQAIRRGLEHDEFQAWFQPIVDLQSRAVRGHEALVRWHSSENVTAGPARFVPIAEMAGLAPTLDLRVLEQSLETLGRLPDDQFVSVNVSAGSLHSAEYRAAAVELFARTGVDTTRVHLEITETALVSDIHATVDAMEHLATYGAQWYLDDFGTGFSSLAHLRDMPVRGLKLDMSFTQAAREGDAAMIRLTQGLAGLAVGLGLETIAEGIDDETVATLLSGQGWSFGQGFLFGQAARLG